MSGYPHGLTAPHGNDYVLRGNEIKPVLHIIDWREDGVATVRWCGKKFLSDPVVLKKGETKPCPVCAIELRYDRKKKEVVEGGFPCVPNRTGGQMNVQGALEDIRGERICADDHMHWDNHCHACTGYLAQGELVDRLAPIIERALRAAFWEGVGDAQYAELHPKDKYTKLDDKEGVTAGVVAMMEELNE